MTLSPIGTLTEYQDIDEWLESVPMNIPYFDGLKLKFILEEMTDGDRSDFSEAITNFLQLLSEDRVTAGKYVFRNFEDVMENVGAQYVDVRITDSRSVWQHVQPLEIHVSRRPYGDKLVYVQILAECDWEKEHGVQIVYRKGLVLTRVSSQDGHLAHCDAYDLPEDEDRIV